MIYSLCGFMGAGKSTIGKILANEYAYGFVDLDNYVENKFGKTITQLFNDLGEDKFREEEYNALNEVIINYKQLGDKKKYGLIISLGGGTIVNSKSVELLKKETFSIYLKCSKEVLFKRLKKNNSHRPLLCGKSDEEILNTISNMMDQRESNYINVANLIFDTKDYSLRLIVEKLKEVVEF
jgi:Shikimate kinase